MGSDSISMLTVICAYWSNKKEKFVQWCFHFLTRKKNSRSDYFYALNVILKKLNEVYQFKPTRVIKACDGCASENRSAHVLAHLVKVIDHTVVYKVLLIIFLVLCFLFYCFAKTLFFFRYLNMAKIKFGLNRSKFIRSYHFRDSIFKNTIELFLNHSKSTANMVIFYGGSMN